MKRLPLHPFIFSAYFVLALLGLNIDQVRPLVVLRPLLLTLTGAGLLFGLLRLLLRDSLRAAAAATLLIGLFFTYGHIYHFLEGQGIFLGRHRLLLPLWGALAVLGLWRLARRRSLENLTHTLNIIGMVALLFPIVQIVSFEARTLGGNSPQAGSALALPQGPARDVYFIVLDEYTSSALMQEVFDWDNTDFLHSLEEMGFLIVPCSQSNYAQTELVLASILNLDYLPALDERFADGSGDHALLRRLIHNSAVEDAFRELGYTSIAFETGYYFSEFEDADVYLASSQSISRSMLQGMNAFEVMLFNSTAGLAVHDLLLLAVDSPMVQDPLEIKRQQVRYTLDLLPRLDEQTTAPRFVFAHVLLPHPPFVFGPDGAAVSYPENVQGEAYLEAYRGQIQFLNQRLLAILAQIIERSDGQAVILLQGDTGPGQVSHAGRMQILSALYLPGVELPELPLGLSPVNNFRLMFDLYFSGSFGLLEDHSYFSPYDAPLDFEPISNGCLENIK